MSSTMEDDLAVRMGYNSLCRHKLRVRRWKAVREAQVAKSSGVYS